MSEQAMRQAAEAIEAQMAMPGQTRHRLLAPALAALRAALEQPQEPVACASKGQLAALQNRLINEIGIVRPEDAAANTIPLFTRPPLRELSDEYIGALALQHGLRKTSQNLYVITGDNFFSLARALLAKARAA